MSRPLYAYRYVKGDPGQLEQALLSRGRELLQMATGSPDVTPAADGSFPLDIPTHVAGIDLAKRVRATVGVARRHGGWVVLPLTWHAEPARHAFPAFDGAVELQPLDQELVQLTLAGEYKAPLGPLGAVADSAGLRAAADATARWLVKELARELERAARSEEDVASLASHPTLRIGGPLRVNDVMTADPLTIPADVPLRTAALLLHSAEISGAPVVADDGELIGVLSERDLLSKEASVTSLGGRRGRADRRRRDAVTAGDACTRPARVTSPASRLAEAVGEMVEQDVGRLVVVDAGRIAGIVTRHDVLAALIREDADLQHAVQQTLDRRGLENVSAYVVWGEVTLEGIVHSRSTAERLPDVVRATDGIMAVHADGLAWEIDDTVPLAPLS